MSISFYLGSLLYNDDSFQDFQSLKKPLLHLIRVIIMSTCDPKALEKGGGRGQTSLLPHPRQHFFYWQKLPKKTKIKIKNLKKK
jgi:hypothetical protein